MKPWKRILTFLPLAMAVLANGASADVHLVDINEYYTQCSDGTTAIQYIELKSAAIGNFFRQCASIQVKRTVAGADVFFAKPVFVGHLDSEGFPRNRLFLIATPGYTAKTGITPDLVMPNGTLDPAGGVIRFAADSGCAFDWGTIHEVRYGDQGTDPAPGPNQAANFNATTLVFSLGTTSPTNFASQNGGTWTCAPPTAVPEPGVLPSAFALGINQPNPFRSHTTFRFDLPDAVPVELLVLNVSGTIVRRLEQGHFEAGRYTASWNGLDDGGMRTVPGVYFYRLVAGRHVETRKAILLP